MLTEKKGRLSGNVVALILVILAVVTLHIFKKYGQQSAGLNKATPSTITLSSY